MATLICIHSLQMSDKSIICIDEPLDSDSEKPTSRSLDHHHSHRQQQPITFDTRLLEEVRRASWPADISIRTTDTTYNTTINLPIQSNPTQANLLGDHSWPCTPSHVRLGKESNSTDSDRCDDCGLSYLHIGPMADRPKRPSDCSSFCSNVSATSSSGYASSPTHICSVPQIDPCPSDAHIQSVSTTTPPCVIISDHSFSDGIIHSTFDLNDLQHSGSVSPVDADFCRRDSIISTCSSTSSLSSLGDEDEEVVLEATNSTTTTCLNPCEKSSPWRKVRSLVTSPFIQTYKRQKYPWIQLAGHQGNFLSGQLQGTILKKLCGNELDCFHKLMSDPHLSNLVPKFRRVLVVNEQKLEDLLAKFVNPCVMDIKMGTRTYLEEELIKAKEKPKLRKDMYEKMVAIDPEEPNTEENDQKAITKPRYMIWREAISSTSTLGFRIDGMKLSSNRLKTNTTTKDLKRTKTEDSVRSAIMEFTSENTKFRKVLLEKLKVIRQKLEQSTFFHTHEMIGSSLLFVYDQHHADVWMIDFAKTYPLPEGVAITHRNPWQPGNHEDGYLIGLDNLIRIFSSFIDDR